MSRCVLALAALLALVVAVPAPRPAAACALVGRDERSRPKIEGEEALIVWDEAAKREHFVRRADFGDARHEFAFLVPTPSLPELAAEDDRVFQRLASLYLRPAPLRRAAAGERGRSPAGGSAGADAVTVVHEQRVGQLDATVVSATDAAALAGWLSARGLASNAGLERWLAPYVANGFFITAFHYRPTQSDPHVRSSAVRLSFAADRPFYPYAEPAGGAVDPNRTLRLTVIAPWRAAGRVGSRPWRARTGFAREAPELANARIPGIDPIGPASLESRPPLWMTTFEDRPSRRGAFDLSFERARSQRPVASTIRATVVAHR